VIGRVLSCYQSFAIIEATLGRKQEMSTGWQWFFGLVGLAGLVVALYAIRDSRRSNRRLISTTTTILERLADLNRIFGTFAKSLETLESRATPDVLPVLQHAKVFALGSQSTVQALGQELYAKVPGLPEQFKFWTNVSGGTNAPPGTQFALVNDKVVPVPPNDRSSW
jgi:hypothetical protein